MSIIFIPLIDKNKEIAKFFIDKQALSKERAITIKTVEWTSLGLGSGIS
jgi:hypothetical protein